MEVERERLEAELQEPRAGVGIGRIREGVAARDAFSPERRDERAEEGEPQLRVVTDLITEEEMREFCKGQISHQKIPRYFQFVTSYPMTASGKVQKFVLREQAIQELGLEVVAKTRTA